MAYLDHKPSSFAGLGMSPKYATSINPLALHYGDHMNPPIAASCRSSRQTLTLLASLLFLTLCPPTFGQNTPPTISSIANRTIGANLSALSSFTIGDLETPATNLTLSANSTN